MERDEIKKIFIDDNVIVDCVFLNDHIFSSTDLVITEKEEKNYLHLDTNHFNYIIPELTDISGITNRSKPFIIVDINNVVFLKVNSQGVCIIRESIINSLERSNRDIGTILKNIKEYIVKYIQNYNYNLELEHMLLEKVRTANIDSYSSLESKINILVDIINETSENVLLDNNNLQSMCLNNLVVRELKSKQELEIKKKVKDIQRSCGERLGSCITKFNELGYSIENTPIGFAFVKQVDIVPDACFYDNRMWKIKKRYRKKYKLETIMYKLTDIAILDYLALPYGSGRHPNLNRSATNGCEICIGRELKELFFRCKDFSKMSTLINKVEQTLRIINYDSAYESTLVDDGRYRTTLEEMNVVDVPTTTVTNVEGVEKF